MNNPARRANMVGMRVVYLTAGAAGMYCGSCMRDNTLVAALRRTGHDVSLVPLYTPIRTDEPDVSEPCVLYGAINVYLQHRSRLFRRMPARLARWLDAPGLLRRLARMSGGESPDFLGELTLSTLQGRDGRQRGELLKLLDYLCRVKPDLVNLPNAMFVHLARPIREELDVPVICTLTGEDIFIDALPQAHRERVLELIRRQAAHVDGFIATSRYYAEHCRDYLRLPPDALHVVYPGVVVDAAGNARTTRTETAQSLLGEGSSTTPARPFTVGYLARICPAKGLHVLAAAVEILRKSGRTARLVVAGQLNPADRPYLERIKRETHGGLDYLGQPDRPAKLAMLASLDVLSVPTVYREPKGLFVLEALACGVPVIQPNHGAFPELIAATGGGLLVEPSNPAALAEAIAALMDDPARRTSLGRQGHAAVLQSFTDRIMADRTWAVYEHYCGYKHA